MVSRLRTLRESQGRSLADVAKAAGMTHSTLSRLERGEMRLKDFQLSLLADALGVTAAEVVSEAGEVPVVGYIGAGSQVFPFDDHAKGEGLMLVPCPRGLNPAKTVAAIVRGDSMEPYIGDGWRVFYSRDPESDASAVVGRLCVVKVADGGTMVKQVRRGPTPGRFNLVSTNAGLLEDQALEWASPVRHMQAPE